MFSTIEFLSRSKWEEVAQKRNLITNQREKWGLACSSIMEFGGALCKINSQGYRGPEFDSSKPPCTFRIYSTGDSSIFGHGVPDGKVFTDVLGNILNEKNQANLKFQCINGAVPGYSTFQSIIRLELSGWKMSPDLLIIGNIWSDANYSSFSDSELFLRSITWLESFKWKLRRILSYSKLYCYLESKITSPRYIFADSDPRNSKQRVSLNEYTENLYFMVREMRKHGGESILLILPHPSDCINSSYKQKHLPPGQKEMAHPYREIMRLVSRKADVLLADFSVVFSNLNDSLFVDRLHPSSSAHSIMGKFLSKMILDNPVLFEKNTNRCSKKM